MSTKVWGSWGSTGLPQVRPQGYYNWVMMAQGEEMWWWLSSGCMSEDWQSQGMRRQKGLGEQCRKLPGFQLEGAFTATFSQTESPIAAFYSKNSQTSLGWGQPRVSACELFLETFCPSHTWAHMQKPRQICTHTTTQMASWLITVK
jgi:hypothetical protein